MIIGVAAGLFGTVGLRRTTMETIAAAAGRGRRTIYMYFSNKADIYEAVVEDELNRIIKPLKEIVSSEEPFGLVLQKYTAERIKLLQDLGSRNPLLLKDFAQGMSRVEKLKERLARKELEVITPFFHRHRDELNSALRYHCRGLRRDLHQHTERYRQASGPGEWLRKKHTAVVCRY